MREKSAGRRGWRRIRTAPLKVRCNCECGEDPQAFVGPRLPPCRRASARRSSVLPALSYLFFHNDNYFTLHSQQLTHSPVRPHAIFIMGAGMSIRHGAWLFGVPCCLTIEYPHTRSVYTLRSAAAGPRHNKRANFRRNLDFPMKRPFFAK